MPLTCPKCQAPMRQYERSGVHIDQCTECRGIFLDRGELERLTDAETAWHQAPPPVYQGHGDRSHYGGQPGYGHHKKKRRGFLEELFD